MPKLKHHKLFIHDHLNSRELSEAYLSDVSSRGQLFIILELPKNKIDQQSLIDKITKRATKTFAGTDQIDPELILEDILQEMNQLLPELSSVKIRSWLNNLDLVIGIIYRNQVFLAGIGNINALLIHHNQLTPILDKVTNVDSAKIFADIISGSLDEGDALVISANALFDYVSQEKIRRLVKKYTPTAAERQLNDLLETVPDFVSFNAIIVKNPSPNDLDRTASSEAVNVVVKTEKADSETSKSEEEIIEAVATQKESSSKHKKSKKSRGVKTKLVLDPKGFQNIKTWRKLQWFGLAAKRFFGIIKKIFTTLWQTIKNVFLFLFSGKYRAEKEDTILQSSKKAVGHKVSWFSQLNWQKKLALAGLIVVILIFIQSLVFLTQNRADKKKHRVYQETIQEINLTLDEVHASLIYNDEKRAEELLLSIQTLLNNLQIDSEQQAEEIATVQEQTARLLNKVRHINYVAAPLELFDLSTLNNPKQIVQKEGEFYILDQDNLYLLEEEAPQSLTTFSNGKTLADWPAKNKLILSNDQEYVIFNLDNNQIESFSFNQSAGNSSVQDMSIYRNNLYVLDSVNSKIFKYPERGNSFSNGIIWLKEELDLTQAYSLTVDGDIYIISNNGQITKLRKGERDTFNYHQPHPAIGSQAIIKTFADSDYLYIIDPDNQRVIILDKEGSIKDQYTSPKFDNLIDLAIDQDEKAIYLLNNNHLYLLAINE